MRIKLKTPTEAKMDLVAPDPIISLSENPDEEIWKLVPGFTAYEVSSLGRVRRVKKGKGAVRDRVIKTFGIYRFVALSKKSPVGVGTYYWKVRLDELIACTWLGLPPNLASRVDFIDGNPNNLRIDNIRWLESDNYYTRRRLALQSAKRDVQAADIKRYGRVSKSMRAAINEYVQIMDCLPRHGDVELTLTEIIAKLKEVHNVEVSKPTLVKKLHKLIQLHKVVTTSLPLDRQGNQRSSDEVDNEDADSVVSRVGRTPLRYGLAPYSWGVLIDFSDYLNESGAAFQT